MSKDPPLVCGIQGQTAHEICDDVHTGHVRAGNGHGSVRVVEELRGFEKGPIECEPRLTHRGVEPPYMAAGRGKDRPWFTAECMHGVRGDSAHKNSKDAAAAGFERQLAHQFCGAAWSTHQCDSFEPTLSLWLQKLEPPY